jgi:hypothetical protein
LLYDSGRFPLWFRVPALAFGLFALWLAVAITASGLFHIRLWPDFSTTPGSPLLGCLAAFAIAALWIRVWFAHLQILFNESNGHLIVRTRGYFRNYDHRISLSGCREIQLRQVHTGLAGRTRRISAQFGEGGAKDVTDLKSGTETFVALFESTTKLPVRRYEGA